MKKITGQSIFHIFQRALNLLEPRLLDHGGRVAYMLRRMLECDGRYSPTQLDHFLLAGMLHDIGAYKTDEVDKLLAFDCRRVWKHSVYGYLFLRYLSPLQDSASILLYHHLDYNRFSSIACDYKEVAMYLNIVDRVDILLRQNYGRLDLRKLEEGRNARFSGEGLDLFYRAEKKFEMLRDLNSDGQQKHLELWFDCVAFDEEECIGYLKLLSYIIDFKSEQTLRRTATTSVIGLHIANLLAFTEEERKLFYYAILIYDLGMIGIPSDIIKAPRALSEMERAQVQTHVQLLLDILGKDMDKEVIRIAMGHHEKLDGSGYPRHLKGEQIDILQRALAIADILSALSCSNQRRIAYDREEVIRTITAEALHGKLDIQLVKLVTRNLDDIMAQTIPFCEKILTNYHAIKEQAHEILARFDNFD